MKNLFTSNLLKATAAFSLFVCTSSESIAGQLKFPFHVGNHGTVSRPAGSNHRSNALVSRPGNSQDYMPTGSGTWQLDTKSAYTYDSQGRLTSRVYSDPITNQDMYRETTTYDLKGEVIEGRKEDWVNNTWLMQDGEKSIITYNANGLMTERIDQIWNNGAWENSNRQQITYDAAGLRLTETFSDWNAGVWEFSDKQVYSNINGTATEMLVQSYDASTASWQDEAKIHNLVWRQLYDEPSNFILQIDAGIMWLDVMRYNAVYNANGGHVGLLEEVSMTAPSGWENSSRETVVIDNNLNYTGSISEDWDASTNTWQVNSEDREVLTYNGMDITERIFKDNFSPSGILADRAKEVYSNFQTINISAVQKPLTTELTAKVYPNPAQNELKIELPATAKQAAATITDVTGKTWLTQSFKTETVNLLNIEALPKGVYMLQLQTEGVSVVKRIVKQ
jgi:hypothetical protein